MDEDSVTERTSIDVYTSSTEPVGTEHQMIEEILSVVRKDMIAADVRWSFLVAACQSYKSDSCLRPFPPLFVVNGNKDFTGLREVVETVPPFTRLEDSIHSLSEKALWLLHWLLVKLKPSLSVVQKSEVAAVMSLVSCELAVPPPALILEVHPRPGSEAEARRIELLRKHKCTHAYHGSKIENFHSILQHGLQQLLTKNALFGQGVYLSSELLVCLPHSRFGLGWSHSAVGSTLSVVALCEVFMDYPSVSCQVAENVLAGDVPHKMYVVPNSDLLCVRYLLVYQGQSSPFTQRLNQPRSALLSWFQRNKMTICLVGYGIMLASIGLTRNQTFLRYMRQLCYSFGIHF